MKAKINGIEVEGTPREIHELMVEMGPVKIKVENQEPKKFVSWDPDWFKPGARIPVKTIKIKCPSNGPCYCAGACMQ